MHPGSANDVPVNADERKNTTSDCALNLFFCAQLTANDALKHKVLEDAKNSRHGSFRRKIRGPPKISKIFTPRGVAEVLFALERAHLRLLFFDKIAAILSKILGVKIFFLACESTLI